MEGVTTAEDDAKCWAAAQRSAVMVVVVVLVRWAGRAGVRGGKGGGCAVLIGEAGGEEEPAGGEV